MQSYQTENVSPVILSMFPFFLLTNSSDDYMKRMVRRLPPDSIAVIIFLNT